MGGRVGIFLHSDVIMGRALRGSLQGSVLVISEPRRQVVLLPLLGDHGERDLHAQHREIGESTVPRETRQGAEQQGSVTSGDENYCETHDTAANERAAELPAARGTERKAATEGSSGQGSRQRAERADNCGRGKGSLLMLSQAQERRVRPGCTRRKQEAAQHSNDRHGDRCGPARGAENLTDVQAGSPVRPYYACGGQAKKAGRKKQECKSPKTRFTERRPQREREIRGRDGRAYSRAKSDARQRRNKRQIARSNAREGSKHTCAIERGAQTVKCAADDRNGGRVVRWTEDKRAPRYPTQRHHYHQRPQRCRHEGEEPCRSSSLDNLASSKQATHTSPLRREADRHLGLKTGFGQCPLA